MKFTYEQLAEIALAAWNLTTAETADQREQDWHELCSLMERLPDSFGADLASYVEVRG